MVEVVDQPAEMIEAVPRAFPLIHVATGAVRQDGHRRFAVRGPAHHAVFRPDPSAGRRLAKAKDVDIKVEHVVVVGDAHGDVANTRESALDDGGVELVRGKSHDLAARDR